MRNLALSLCLAFGAACSHAHCVAWEDKTINVPDPNGGVNMSKEVTSCTEQKCDPGFLAVREAGNSTPDCVQPDDLEGLQKKYGTRLVKNPNGDYEIAREGSTSK